MTSPIILKETIELCSVKISPNLKHLQIASTLWEVGADEEGGAGKLAVYRGDLPIITYYKDLANAMAS